MMMMISTIIVVTTIISLLFNPYPRYRPTKTNSALPLPLLRRSTSVAATANLLRQCLLLQGSAGC